jgi:hypothetical protein
MARMCSQCKTYDAGGTVQTCPTCQGAMQFTLLPPPGQGAAALALAECEPLTATRSRASQRTSASFALFDFVMRYRKLAGLVVIPFVLICSFFGVNITTAESLKSRYDRIQVGMDVDEVEPILRPPVRWRGRFRVPQHGVLDMVPDEGPYTVNYSEAGSGSITLRFQDGVLVNKTQKDLK